MNCQVVTGRALSGSIRNVSRNWAMASVRPLEQGETKIIAATTRAGLILRASRNAAMASSVALLNRTLPRLMRASGSADCFAKLRDIGQSLRPLPDPAGAAKVVVVSASAGSSAKLREIGRALLFLPLLDSTGQVVVYPRVGGLIFKASRSWAIASSVSLFQQVLPRLQCASAEKD